MAAGKSAELHDVADWWQAIPSVVASVYACTQEGILR